MTGIAAADRRSFPRSIPGPDQFPIAIHSRSRTTHGNAAKAGTVSRSSAAAAQNPAAIYHVRARYHLSEAAHIAESAAWQRRFAADQGLYARYASLFQTYRDWLARPTR